MLFFNLPSLTRNYVFRNKKIKTMVFTYKSERKLLNWLGFFCFVLFFRTKEIVVEGETLWGEGRFEMCFEEAEINSLLRAQHRMPW